MSKKKNKKKIQAKKVDKFLIVIGILLVILLIISLIKDNKELKDNKSTELKEEIKTTEAFNKSTLSEVLELIKSEEITFIYIGYEGCEPCELFVPKLVDVSKEYGIEVNYLNFKELDKKSKEWSTFTKKLTKKQEIEIKGKDAVTKTIGAFLKDEGYTPTFVIFKDGKLIDGYIGGLSRAELRTFLDEAGYSKKA
ncbi:MAG: thioredoxin family protein [Bacilli bacterium]|nr:thioredoxin family protein [Bacilli bacterium]